MGHEIGPDGLKLNIEKIKSITDMAAQKDIEELRRSLGMVGYLGRFIPNLVALYAPGKTLIVANMLSRSQIQNCQMRESVALQSDVAI